MALTPEGLPAFDRNGGLWIKLTVGGVTRIGYGCADGKTGGDAIKEVIGDALRNGGMRFGAALELWHKGVLHADDDGEPAPPVKPDEDPLFIACKAAMDLAKTRPELQQWANDNEKSLAKIKAEKPAVYDAVLALWRARVKEVPKAAPQEVASAFELTDDEIPY
jgi:hypothetical protein